MGWGCGEGLGEAEAGGEGGAMELIREPENGRLPGRSSADETVRGSVRVPLGSKRLNGGLGGQPVSGSSLGFWEWCGVPSLQSSALFPNNRGQFKSLAA